MKNIYLFHGEDSYTAINKSLHWREEFEKKYGDLNTEILDGEDLTAGKYLEAVSTLPFLSEKRFILIQNAFKDTELEELHLIAEKMESTPDHCVVVFAERSKADSKTILFKAIKKYGQILYFPPLDEARLESWITAETQKRGGIISSRTAGYLARSVGSDLWQMTQEIEKLTINAAGREITPEDVDKLASPNIEASIFKLTDNLGLKKRKESLRTLKDMIDGGANLIPTIYTIGGHFRTLIHVKTYMANGLQQPAVIKKLKKAPFVISKAFTQCRNFENSDLEYIYSRLLDIDIALKTSKIKISADDQSELRLALEKLITGFCASR